jgi:hypothetical protein
MTAEEKQELCNRLTSGMLMITEKLTEIGKAKSGWTLDEMGKVSDIIKDVSETHKNLAKAHHLYAEHSEERY